MKFNFAIEIETFIYAHFNKKQLYSFISIDKTNDLSFGACEGQLMRFFKKIFHYILCEKKMKQSDLDF